MTDNSLDDLLAELSLSQQSVAMLKSLPPESQQQMAQVLLSAVRQKDERINGAVNNALSVVPLPLRGAVKKMLFN